MKRKKESKIRWDPIVIKLQEKKGKQELLAHETEQQNVSSIKEPAPFSKVRRSRKEFEAYLKSLFENDSIKVKYRNPDAWIAHNSKMKDESS